MKHNQYNLSPCIAFECHGTYFNNLSKAVATAIREDDLRGREGYSFSAKRTVKL